VECWNCPEVNGDTVEDIEYVDGARGAEYGRPGDRGVDMADPIIERDLAVRPLAQVFESAGAYLESLTQRRVYDPAAEPLLSGLNGPLPMDGEGASRVLDRLLRIAQATATNSSGPRFFHFVVGGATPAAMAADWTASLLDQNAGARGTSRLATEVERIALDWLVDLFGLPKSWGGALVASATFANLTSLGCARHWWAQRHGVDSTGDGVTGLPRMPVLSGGYVHASVRKALQMLGHGRNTVEIYARDGVGRVDLAAMRRRLASLGGSPAVIVASAGEVNAGDFDPIGELADLAGEFGAWLHVDGAFGLYTALSPRTAHLVAGVDRANSVAADGHKWLNVPYESGFAFLAEPDRLGQAFGYPGVPYLPGSGGPELGYSYAGPESSRRARCLPIWATLAAYGRDGYRAMIERHLDLALYLGHLVDSAADLERLAEVRSNIVCFRARPAGVPEEKLDELNRHVGEDIVVDGRVFVGTTVYDGVVALRPALTNWRTTRVDIELMVAVIRELAAARA
jgi:glutamate/tyrosine decarboxylase-like PLP-dependent enzyme